MERGDVVDGFGSRYEIRYQATRDWGEGDAHHAVSCCHNQILVACRSSHDGQAVWSDGSEPSPNGARCFGQAADVMPSSSDECANPDKVD